jgi:erythronate-4-phosphate dehydrogenase
MILLADRHIPWLDELLPPDITLHRFVGGRPPTHLLSQAEALLIRTVTKVDADLLASAPNLRWIGSATAGFDHIDVDAVRAAGIDLYIAEGCNASAVGGFVRRSLLVVSRLSLVVRGEEGIRQTTNNKPLTIALIGFGHTGRASAEQLKKLDIEVIPYDPPLGLPATWEDVLACDAVSVHVPLTFDGPYKTHHLITEQDFARANWKVIIQASRGGVVDEAALKQWIRPGERDAIVDVWENEPTPDPELVRLAAIATPHIAGYSVEAKYRATKMCLVELLSVFGSRFSVEELSVFSSRFSVNRETMDVGRGTTDNRQPKTVNPLEILSRALKADPTAETFQKLRNNSPLRSEAE